MNARPRRAEGAPTQDGPSPDRLYSIRTDGSRRKLHPADVRGRFLWRRRIVFALLLALYLALPLVRVGGHPAVYLDIEARRFFLLGGVFDSRDVWRALFLLLGFAFALLFFSAWLGRAWCGWACPQTVFLEGIYRPIERLIDGPAARRIRLDQAPCGAKKIARRLAKHALFAAVSLAVAHVALSLVVSAHSLVGLLRQGPGAHPEAFGWTMTVAAAFYLDFAWFREQLCIALCPYGRLQSVLIDRDSLTIGYDPARGEPRRHAEAGGARAAGAGDCVDCNRCVAVCPTGIDIRAGQQLECIACAQCIDACDEIMDRLGRPRGLVRYDSARALEGQGPTRVLRSRLIVYGALLASALGGLVAATVGRTAVELSVLRVRGAPYVLEEGRVRNAFELHLVNKASHAIRVAISGQHPGLSLVMPAPERALEPLESIRVPVFASMPERAFVRPFELELQARELGSGEVLHASARFLGPMR